MSGCSSSRRAAQSAWRTHPFFEGWRVSAVCGALLAGCLPEHALSSYTGQGGTAPATTSGSGGSPPDTGPVDAGVPSEGNGAAGDAAPTAHAAPEPLPVLDCRDDCACERGSLGEFMFCPTPVSHDEALERCSLAGGSLASVDDAPLNAWLSARMAELDADDFWLSGTDAEDEGVWRWGDGRVFFDVSADGGALRSFAPWDEGQPNDLNGEDCMRSTGGVWRDLDCSDAIAFVCQG